MQKNTQITEKTTESDPDKNQEETTENASAEETSEEISVSDASGIQDEMPVLAATEETAGIAPTILLKIISGPEYAQGDQICFYRVRADVTGDPSPVLIFSKDDSNGAWGTDTVQVNLKKNESYSLSCGAENGFGSAESTLVLSWVDRTGTESSTSGGNTSQDPAQIDYSVPGDFLLDVNLSTQRVTLLHNGAEIRNMVCSGGTPQDPTPLGEFTTTRRYIIHIFQDMPRGLFTGQDFMALTFSIVCL